MRDGIICWARREKLERVEFLELKINSKTILTRAGMFEQRWWSSGHLWSV